MELIRRVSLGVRRINYHRRIFTTLNITLYDLEHKKRPQVFQQFLYAGPLKTVKIDTQLNKKAPWWMTGSSSYNKNHYVADMSKGSISLL